jgi:hypothetical protein
LRIELTYRTFNPAPFIARLPRAGGFFDPAGSSHSISAVSTGT